MSRDAVRAYYASFGEREWARLENPDDGAVEFAITCHTLATYLPQEARVLDIGGGPGRYAIWLAQWGHRVVLADFSPELLSLARAKNRVDVVGVSAHPIQKGTLPRRLPVGDGRFHQVPGTVQLVPVPQIAPALLRCYSREIDVQIIHDTRPEGAA